MYTRDLLNISPPSGEPGLVPHCSCKPAAEQKMFWVRCCHRLLWSTGGAGNNAGVSV